MGHYAVLCLPFAKLERTAGAMAQGLRVHFETIVLASEVGEVILLPELTGLSGSSFRPWRFTVYCALHLLSALCQQSSPPPRERILGSRARSVRTGSLRSKYSKV